MLWMRLPNGQAHPNATARHNHIIGGRVAQAVSASGDGRASMMAAGGKRRSGWAERVVRPGLWSSGPARPCAGALKHSGSNIDVAWSCATVSWPSNGAGALQHPSQAARPSSDTRDESLRHGLRLPCLPRSRPTPRVCNVQTALSQKLPGRPRDQPPAADALTMALVASFQPRGWSALEAAGA